MFSQLVLFIMFIFLLFILLHVENNQGIVHEKEVIINARKIFKNVYFE